MQAYRRVLAVIDVDRRGESVARNAWELARRQGACLALGHVLDYGRGFDCDHAPFLTPEEVETKLTAIVRRHLAALARRLGAPDAACLVAGGPPEHGVATLAAGWQPDVVIVGAQAAHGLRDGVPLATAGAFSRVVCDVSVIPDAVRPALSARLGWWGRLRPAR